MKSSLLLLIPLLFAGCHRSCPKEFRNPGGEVTSLGYGTIQVAPDMARIFVEVQFTRATMKEAMEETQKTMNDLLGICRNAAVDSNDIKTTQVSAEKSFEWEWNKNVFKGYAATQFVVITLRDLTKISPLMESLLNTHASNIGGVTFDHSKADSLQSEANALAMLDAKRNVSKMCRAVSLTCEEMVSAKTVPAEEGRPMVAEARMEKRAMPLESTISVRPGLMTFSATVEAAYRVK